MAFDGIVTKAITSELSQLTGARIDKVFEPNKNTIVSKWHELCFKYMYRFTVL